MTTTTKPDVFLSFYIDKNKVSNEDKNNIIKEFLLAVDSYPKSILSLIKIKPEEKDIFISRYENQKNLNKLIKPNLEFIDKEDKIYFIFNISKISNCFELTPDIFNNQDMWDTKYQYAYDIISYIEDTHKHFFSKIVDMHILKNSNSINPLESNIYYSVFNSSNTFTIFNNL